jgi:hypothetical protein
VGKAMPQPCPTINEPSSLTRILPRATRHWATTNALQSRTFQGQGQGADSDAARVRALAAYKDFLALWKDADSDIPILKQAKAEYAKLQ